jgi:hypothetical protein
VHACVVPDVRMSFHLAAIEDRPGGYRFVFRHETGEVVKRIVTYGLEWKVAADPRQALALALSRCIVEAERDIAYRMFGDAWGSRVTRRGTPERMALLKRMSDECFALRPELFA